MLAFSAPVRVAIGSFGTLVFRRASVSLGALCFTAEFACGSLVWVGVPALVPRIGQPGCFGFGHLALVVDGASGCVVWAVRCPCGRMAGGVADATGLRLGLCF